MAHAIWSGAINFGLVTIPVKLFTAVKTDELSFNMLHAKDEGRIKYERVCSVDGKPVPWDEIVKGYEYEKGEYVMLTDEDFKKVNPEATQSVDISNSSTSIRSIRCTSTSRTISNRANRENTPTRCLREALTESNKVGDRSRGDPHEGIHRRGQADRRSAGARADALGQ